MIEYLKNALSTNNDERDSVGLYMCTRQRCIPMRISERPDECGHSTLIFDRGHISMRIGLAV